MTIDEALKRPTISIPDAGRLFFGLERNGSYEAARQGIIPTIKAGQRRMVVPVKPLAEKFGLTVTFGNAA